MGKTMLGSTSHAGNVQLGTQQQQDLLSTLLGAGQQQGGQALAQLLQGPQQGQFQDLFQQSYIDPALQTFEQQVLPAIQERFVGANAASSSALNQALGQSAKDLSTMLGGQMGQFYQGQQQNQLAALGMLGQLGGQRTFEPMIQQRQGLLGPLIGAGGQLAGGALGFGF